MTEATQNQEGHNTFAGCAVRLFWMGAGNLLLAFFAVLLAQRQMLALSFLDLGYWLTAGAMVGVRWLDVSRLHGLTVEGEPATKADWRRYARGLPAVSAGVWVLAHLLAATDLMR
jgi:hypothetical protein